MGSTGTTGVISGFEKPGRDFSNALYNQRTSDVTNILKEARIDSQIQFKQRSYTDTYRKVSPTKWQRELDLKEVTNRSLADSIIRSYKLSRGGTLAKFYEEKEFKVRWR